MRHDEIKSGSSTGFTFDQLFIQEPRMKKKTQAHHHQPVTGGQQ
ncbi:MAG: hypothetical protein ACTFAL_08295 [Candidatus Electronema sp. V4]